MGILLDPGFYFDTVGRRYVKVTHSTKHHAYAAEVEVNGDPVHDHHQTHLVYRSDLWPTLRPVGGADFE